jgi:DnaJ-class molecular chaperone
MNRAHKSKAEYLAILEKAQNKARVRQAIEQLAHRRSRAIDAGSFHECPACNATGLVAGVCCDACDGDGMIVELDA